MSIREYVEHIINIGYDALPDDKKRELKENEVYIFSFFGEPKFFVKCAKGQVDVMGVAARVRFKHFIDFAYVRTAAFTYADGDKDLVEGHEFEVTARTGEEERITVHKDLVAGSSKVSRWKGNA